MSEGTAACAEFLPHFHYTSDEDLLARGLPFDRIVLSLEIMRSLVWAASLLKSQGLITYFTIQADEHCRC